MKVVVSPQALDDLAAIGDWIARDNLPRAQSFVAELRQACGDLATFPRAYPEAPQFGPDARKRSYGNYLIIYDVVDDLVTVITVVHAARDWDRMI